MTKQGHNNFECQATENAIYLNDLSEKLFGENEEKRNLEFKPKAIDQFENYNDIKKFEMSNFTFDEKQKMTHFNNKTEFCLDKLNDQWIVLAENDKTLWLIPISITKT